MIHTASISEEKSQRSSPRMLRYLNAAKDGKSLPDLSSRALERLHRYAESWFECAPNAIDWRNRYPGHWQTIGKSLERTHLTLVAGADGCIGAWDLNPRVLESKNADLWRADKLFADFLVESHQKRISVCKGCGHYFERTPKRTAYCTTACGTDSTSKAAKSEKRHNNRHRKLACTLKEVQKLRKRESAAALLLDGYWKEEVIESTRGTISMRWLNEATDPARQTADNPFAACDRCAAYRKQILGELGLEI
jgi:hypothetical protein